MKLKSFLFSLLAFISFSANSQIATGYVKDKQGHPLRGVTISEKGTANATASDSSGHYAINVAAKSTLVFSGIGFIPQEIRVGSNRDINITLEREENAMDEVVVVGYGTQKKINLTGAVAQVTSKVLESRPAPGLTRMLQGALPNLNIKIVDGNPTRGASYNIRGATSIGAGGSALILIDGVEGDPNLVNPNDVESVSILKDASSAAIYGSRAAFGVVLITTKTAKKGKVKVDFNSSYTINQRIITPKGVTNGYQWAKNFDEAFNAWYDYKSHPISVNNIYPFSLEYLDELKKHSEDPGLPEVVFNKEKIGTNILAIQIGTT